MIDYLQRQFVPKQDGGVFNPLLQYGFELLSNSSTLFGLLSNNGAQSKAPQIGGLLSGWYLGRVNEQTPLFAGASVWLLLSLVALICAVILTTRRHRLPCSPNRTDKSPPADGDAPRSCPADPYIVSNPSLAPSLNSLELSVANSSNTQRWLRRRRREKLLTLRLVLLISVFVICTATLGVYWSHSGGYGFGRLFQRSPDKAAVSDGSDGGGSGGGSLAVAVNSAVLQLNAFIADTLISTNSSVLEVCYEALPSILDLVNRIASRYLDLLSADFLLTPLLNSFDKFLNLVKLLLGSMNAIKDSRNSVLNPLNSFTTVINKTREDLRAKVNDVCLGSPINGVPLALCNGIERYINLLTIGLDARRIDADSSVTIVTMLDKIFKLNVTEIEGQVNSAKSLLTGSLSVIGKEITSLFNSLVDEVSKQFKSALAGANQLGSEMINATQSDSFVSAFNTGDTVLQIISAVIVVVYSLTLASVFVITVFLVYFYYQRGQLEAIRNDRQMGGDGPPADFATHPEPLNEVRPPLRSLHSIMEHRQETLPRHKEELGTKELIRYRRMHRGMRLMKTLPMIRVMFVLGVFFALMFAFGFALLYAGSEIQQDACSYLTLPSSTSVVDRQLDRLIDDNLWPLLRKLLAEKINLPLPLTQSMLPKGLLGVLLRDCRNSSATIFQIYHLVDAFNLTDLLKADEVKNVLYKGRETVDKLIGGLNVNTLIPAQVDTILAALPQFATIVDTQDFSASISELSKPLLSIGDRLPLLLGDLQAMVRILQDRNPSDNRAILIQHFAENLNSIYTTDYPALNASLYEIRRHFLTLQNNRLVLNLTGEVTGNLARLKIALSNKTALLSAVASRYDQVLTEHTPELAASLNSLLSRILSRVGRCNGLSSVLGIVANECAGSLAALPYGGFYVCLSSALLVLLTIGAMPVLRAARWHKKAAKEQDDWSASTTSTESSTTIEIIPQANGPNGTSV